MSIENIKIKTVIGVHAWERKIQRTLRFDVEFGIDAAMIAQSDDIANALNYDKLVAVLNTCVASQSFSLIETLAQRAAEHLMEAYACAWLRLRVSKPKALADADNVSVVVERTGSL